MEPRVCIVGTHGYAVEHIRAVRSLERSGHAMLAGIVRDPRHGAEPAGETRLFLSYQELLNSGPQFCDLVVLPLPIHLHAKYGITALRRGFRVLTEKPLAGCTEQARLLVAAGGEDSQTGQSDCAQTGGVAPVHADRLYIGYQHACAEPGRLLYETARSGRLGPILEVTAFGAWPRSRAYYTRNNWAGRLRLDDQCVMDCPIQNAFAHVVHLAILAMQAAETGGKPGPARAALRASPPMFLTPTYVFQSRINWIESADTQAVEAVGPNGAVCRFGLTHACDTRINPTLTIRFKNGQVLWTMTADGVRLTVQDHTTAHTVIDPHTGRTVRMYKALMDRQSADFRLDVLKAAVEHVRFSEAVLRHPISSLCEASAQETVIAEEETGPDPSSPVRHVPGTTDLLRRWINTGDVGLFRRLMV